MNLSEVITTAKTILSEVTEFANISIFADDMTRSGLEAALQERGLALVLIQESGAPIDPNAPDLALLNTLIVSVVENPKVNLPGPSALEAVGLVLKALHQYEWPNRGLKNALKVDNQAYMRGELDSGLVTYFCNFLIKTIQ